MDHCDIHPSFRRFREGFVVLTQPTTPSDPRQCLLNYPSSWQHGKLMTATRTPHNLQGIARRGLNPIYQLPGVSCVSPNQSQAGKPSFQLVHNQPCPVPVLDVSRVNHDSQQHPYGIHDDVTQASHHLLTSVKATRPPFSVVLTDWLSMIAALVGVHSLPSARRTSGRRASWTCSQMPSLFHLRKYWYTVCHGGKSCGSIRHGQPVRRT